MQDNHPIKVLIVDDEPLMREVLCAVLSERGCICKTANDGKEGFRKFSTEDFDAVITDVVMPHMDGITMTRLIRSESSSIPIMVMTAFCDRFSAESAMEAGACEFIVKPFSLEEVSIRFQRMVASRRNI